MTEAEDAEPSAAPSDAEPAPPKKKTRRGTRGGARRKTAAAGPKAGAEPPVDGEQESAATGPEAVEDTSDLRERRCAAQEANAPRHARRPRAPQAVGRRQRRGGGRLEVDRGGR